MTCAFCGSDVYVANIEKGIPACYTCVRDLAKHYNVFRIYILSPEMHRSAAKDRLKFLRR